MFTHSRLSQVAFRRADPAWRPKVKPSVHEVLHEGCKSHATKVTHFAVYYTCDREVNTHVTLNERKNKLEVKMRRDIHTYTCIV